MDEFKAFQAKVQDQVKQEVIKDYEGIINSVQKVISEKVINMEIVQLQPVPYRL